MMNTDMIKFIVNTKTLRVFANLTYCLKKREFVIRFVSTVIHRAI